MVEIGYKSALIFEEEMPPYLVNSGVRSMRQIKVLVWLLRFFALFFIAIMLISHIFTPSPGLWIVDLACLSGVFLILIYSEVLMRGERASAYPIKIAEQGIWTYPGNDHRVLKKKGYASRSEIELVEIKRYPAYQRLTYDNQEGILWKDAPIELVIHTKEGKKIITGPKPPDQIMKIVSILVDRWKIPVIDKGAGPGIAIKCRNGKPINE